MLSALRTLGVTEGDTLLVHSSFKALGPRARDPAQVVDILRRAVGPSGTLLMPALSYATVDAAHPVFDVRRTVGCVGVIPETFRRQAEVCRSLSPTHSVCAAGRKARDMTAEHHRDDTPVGPHSPLSLLAEEGGKILFLGCSPDVNTSMHGVEERIGPPYLFEAESVAYRCVDADGKESILTVRRHGFVVEGKPVIQRYGRLTGLLEPGEWTAGRVGDAACTLMDARAVWEKGLAAIKKDPWFFVDRF